MCPSRNFSVETSDQTSTIWWRPWEEAESECSESGNKQSHVTHESCFSLSRASPSPLRCNMCAATFKRDSELKRHKSSKHSTKREKCKVCLKDFTRKDNLTRHMKLAHSSENKPFCQHCLKALSRKDAVQRHESTCTKNPNRVKTIPNDTVVSLTPVHDKVYSFQFPARLRMKMEKRTLNE